MNIDELGIQVERPLPIGTIAATSERSEWILHGKELATGSNDED